MDLNVLAVFSDGIAIECNELRFDSLFYQMTEMNGFVCHFLWLVQLYFARIGNAKDSSGATGVETEFRQTID